MTRKFATTPTTPAALLVTGADLPQLVTIRTVQKPARVSVAGAWDSIGGLDNVMGNAYGFSNDTNGIWWEYDVVLPKSKPGYCWAIKVTYFRNTAIGIMQFTVDGVANLPLDGYQAATARGASSYTYVGDAPTYVTNRAKKIVVRIACTGKNALSSNYMIIPLSFGFNEVLIP